MLNENKTVVGSYSTQEKALDVISRLKNEGYPKNDIILYSNEEQASAMSHYEAHDVVVDTDENSNTKKYTNDEDQSMWDKIKDAFMTDTYDQKKENKRDDYDQTKDFLYPYKEDIEKGYFVVAVENYRGEPTEKIADAGNTSAMPSNAGTTVDDPGNTSVVPSDTGKAAHPTKDKRTIEKEKELKRENETRMRYKK
ncbi:general stress protein [Alkalibacterium kapii]|uniref:Uncharacterized protein n=1 Tax=Alkalibacterium kapii TaxID=426704 RepID=A0A511AR29_9LACT|nr:general stress protein [Alkalibacterium kapii]GEK90664.1 hypothetical protein AKA01nite_02860 [Alkalibacterium kapii]